MLDRSVQSCERISESVGINVSRETLDKLIQYQNLLHKWQKAVNLVSKNTLAESWERHFLDSIQLEKYLSDDDKVILDMGSGAGFPGAVLAILRPNIEVHLVESDSKKCSFLNAVSRETNIPIFVHSQRIEAFEFDKKIDVISARALASITQLCDYSYSYTQQNPQARMLLLKGQKTADELAETAEKYTFETAISPSKTDETGTVVVLTNLNKKPET